VVYEARPCGFVIWRHLATKGIACDVVAPSAIPKRAGDRVEEDKEAHTSEIDSDAEGGTRRSRGHWGTLDNVIEQRPGGNAWPMISAPRAKAAPRRKLVLRYQPSNISMSNRRTSITGGSCRLRRVPRPAAGYSPHLDLQRNRCRLLTERSHINV
jgi:hypothetical protein